MKKLKVAFDVGGVLSKYPEQFKLLFEILAASPLAEVYVISDMHPVSQIVKMLDLNWWCNARIYSADYKTLGERCKAVLCEELGIDILIDDFVGYLADGKHIRLLVMPDSSKPYYADEWKTDGSEGDFGRRRAATKP